MSSNGQADEKSSTSLRHDFLASVVVFLVALPLCMGIAIASGVPVAAGLITGIVGGIVVGSLSGSPLQVSGPAAGLTVIVFEIVQRFGLESLGLIVLIAGLIQMLAGYLKLGQWFRAVSPAVIKGMLAGIGVLILGSQFHVMVDDKPKGSGIANLVTIPQAIWKGLAVPSLGERDSRKYRTEMLRNVGELHRQQVLLYEHLAESVPHHVGNQTDATVLPPSISSRATEQRQITESLQDATRQLDEFETQDPDRKRAERIQRTANLAIEASQSALTAIEAQDPQQILSTQAVAVASLESFLDAQKNHHHAATVGLLTILIILGWQGLAPKKVRVIPGPLVAVSVVTLLSALLVMPVLYVEIPDNLMTDIHFPTWTVMQEVSWPAIIQAGIVIAAVASAETLLCATAVDQMHQGARTKYDRELAAQGVGNAVCGLLGALPMTGVIVRSSANVQAGARTRLSAILHGIWLLIFVAVLAFVLRQIPTASLAAILVYTGYKLINPMSIVELKKYGWGEVFIYGATVTMIVVTDLLTGVIVGIALAAIKLLNTFAHLDAELVPDPDSNRITLQLHGAATFVRLPRLATKLEDVPPGAELHVDFEHLDYIDHACLDLLLNWAKQHETGGGKLVIDWGSLQARFNQRKSRAAALAAKGVAEEQAADPVP